MLFTALIKLERYDRVVRQQCYDFASYKFWIRYHNVICSVRSVKKLYRVGLRSCKNTFEISYFSGIHDCIWSRETPNYSWIDEDWFETIYANKDFTLYDGYNIVIHRMISS